MAETATVEIIGTLTAAFLTIMVLSYLVGDNVLFRLAAYLFVGVASGYAGAIAWHHVVWAHLFLPITEAGIGVMLSPSGFVTLVIPWVLAILLLFKLSPRTTRYGTLPVALLVGVGAAVVVGGGITGTLVPQSLAAMETLNPAAEAPLTGETGLERVVNVLIMLAGTISTLIYFRFTARREPSGEARRTRWTAWVAFVGRLFIAVTFGVMYAGALAASIVILADRIQFLRDVVRMFLTGS
jgi:hypothetical protein